MTNHATYKTLIAAGINHLHAAAITKSITSISNEISKHKIANDEIKKFGAQLIKLTNEIEKLELKMVIKLGSIVAVCSSLLFTAIKFGS